jgi:predicted hydrocarbon binding protein
VENCPACRERTSNEPDCHILAGILQETLSWAGGGRVYRVRELECSAAGAPACLFQIDKKPLE